MSDRKGVSLKDVMKKTMAEFGHIPQPINRKCSMCGEPVSEIYRSPYFCSTCDKKRITRISKSLDKISDALSQSKGGSDSE